MIPSVSPCIQVPVRTPFKQQDGGARNSSQLDRGKATGAQSGTLSSSANGGTSSTALGSTPHCAEQSDRAEGRVSERQRKEVKAMHVDIIADQFWTEHPEIIGSDSP